MSDLAPDVVDAYRARHTYVGGDAETDPRLLDQGRAATRAFGLRSSVVVPLVKGGKLRTVLGVDAKEPRVWCEHTLRLLEDVADRTWAAVERTRAEASLRESEQRLRDVLDSMAEGFALLRSDFTIVDVNEETLRLDGRTRDELVGRSHWDAFPDTEESPVGQTFKRVARDRVPGALEHEYRWPDGRSLWIDMRAYPTRDAGVAIFWRDITDRKRAEAALRESESRLAAAFESVPAGVAAVDATGKAIIANGEYRRFLPNGVIPSRDPLRGSRWQAWDDEGRPIAPEDYPDARALRGESVIPGQELLYTDDEGRKIWTNVATTPTFDPAGRVTGILSVISDINDRRQAEAAVRASERQLQTLMEGVPQLVWRAVDDGRWTWASPQWTAQTGQAEVDSHGRGWLAPVHPDDRARVEEVWAGAVERGEFHADYRLCHVREHRYRWFQTRATPVRDDRGRIVEWLGTSTDVDDLRQLQERQQVLVAELQHRTFNLMAVVRSMADATIRSSADLEEFKPTFRNRIDALARVQRLLSRLQEDDRVSFDELIRGELDAVGALQDGAPRVVLSGPEGVALRSSTVQTLAMALHELTTNAVKYGALRQRGARLSVSWRVQAGPAGEPWLHVLWRETGVSMPPPDEKAQGTGQGRTLIEKALPYQLRAKTSYELAPDGVRCSIALPVSARTSTETEPSPA